MARKPASDIDELLSRSEADVPSRKRTAPPPSPPEPERRYIYGGDPQEKIPGYAVPPANKKGTPKKRRSTFSIVSFLFLAAIGIILYIGNILTVNELAMEVHQLQAQYAKMTNTNNVLKAEINRKSAWERIGDSAKQKIGLIYPKERPQSFDVEADKLKKFTEE